MSLFQKIEKKKLVDYKFKVDEGDMQAYQTITSLVAKINEHAKATGGDQINFNLDKALAEFFVKNVTKGLKEIEKMAADLPVTEPGKLASEQEQK